MWSRRRARSDRSLTGARYLAGECIYLGRLQRNPTMKTTTAQRRRVTLLKYFGATRGRQTHVKRSMVTNTIIQIAIVCVLVHPTLIIHITDYVCVCRVRLLSVCLSVCLSGPEHNSETNDPKVFKLGRGNDLGISYKTYGFGLKDQRSRLGLRLTSMSAA